MKHSAPDSVDAFHQRLKEVSGNLPKRLHQVASHLAQNTDRIAVSTVAELAAGAEVQPSALIRFCQIMGFSGFSEMQKIFRSSYTHSRPDYATRLKDLHKAGAGSPSALLAEFVEAGRKSLETLANTVDARALDRSVAMLAKAETIHVVGMRRSFPVAAYLAYAFDKMGIPAMLHDGVARLDQGNAVRRHDVLIAISFSPYNQATVELAANCRRRDIPVVAITDTQMSPLRGNEDFMLYVSEVDFGNFRALSATLSLAITLAVAVGSARE